MSGCTARYQLVGSIKLRLCTVELDPAQLPLGCCQLQPDVQSHTPRHLVRSLILIHASTPLPACPPHCCRPCIMVGSSFGVLLGLLLRQLLPAWWSIQPGVYAVVCATAMLGAVFRSSISLVAIMIEGTRGIGERRCWAVLC